MSSVGDATGPNVPCRAPCACLRLQHPDETLPSVLSSQTSRVTQPENPGLEKPRDKHLDATRFAGCIVRPGWFVVFNLGKFMKRMQFVLALALVGSMGSAAAAAVGQGYPGDLVGQNLTINNTVSGSGTPIADVFSFDIDSLLSDAIATSVNVKLQFSGSTLVYDISNFAITLKDTSGYVYAFDNMFDSSGALNLQATMAPPTLGSAFYQFVVTGTTAATNGGSYAGALATAPMPEPQTWLKLLAGLGLVGMMVGRIKYRPD